MKPRIQEIRHLSFVSLTMIFLAVSVFCSQVDAATYYISPTGSDSNSGASTSPWKTFAYATSGLVAGDTLLLKDGVYSLSANGNGTRFISLSGKHGTASLPITIKAENERQAFLSQDGTGSHIYIANCSYISIEGIRAKSADKNVNPSEGFFYALGGHHISFKRNLLSNNNRYRNETPIHFDQSHFGLVEENEVYSFHRNGIAMSASNNGTVRRNYINSRSYADIAGGLPSAVIDDSRGDDAVVLYPASNTLVENNISENSHGGFSIQANGTSIGNKFLGNISIGDGFGYHNNARCQDSAACTPTDTVYNNNLALNSTVIAFYIRTSYNTTGTNNTAIGANSHGFAWDKESTNGVPGRTFFFNNTLSFNNGQYGTYIDQQNDWLLDYVNSYNNNSVNFAPSTDAKRTHSSTANPNLGGCRVWIPVESPMKGTGKNGGDIGANILYRYQDGVLTSTPLWNSDGSFPVGAVIAGVNDITGGSASNVHQRLNVNTNGCSFPAGYGSATITSAPAPTGLRIAQ